MLHMLFIETENGELKCTATYKNGELEGEVNFFSENEQKQCVSTFQNGEIID